MTEINQNERPFCEKQNISCFATRAFVRKKSVCSSHRRGLSSPHHTEQPTCSSAVAAANPPSDLQEWARRIQDLRQRTLAEVAHVVVGMDKVVQRFLVALLAGGHVLLEGVPGVAKTTLAKTLAQLLGLQF